MDLLRLTNFFVDNAVNDFSHPQNWCIHPFSPATPPSPLPFLPPPFFYIKAFLPYGPASSNKKRRQFSALGFCGGGGGGGERASPVRAASLSKSEHIFNIESKKGKILQERSVSARGPEVQRRIVLNLSVRGSTVGLGAMSLLSSHMLGVEENGQEHKADFSVSYTYFEWKSRLWERGKMVNSYIIGHSVS
jgi:hypothetical protein